MLPQRERLLQIARLAGAGAFTERFGAPQTAEPAPDALRAFADERADTIAQGLVAEAAASDDVTGIDSAAAYLDDRLRTLSLDPATADRIRAAFRDATKGW